MLFEIFAGFDAIIIGNMSRTRKRRNNCTSSIKQGVYDKNSLKHTHLNYLLNVFSIDK